MAAFIGSTLKTVDSNTSDFSPTELDITKTETSMDLIDLSIQFVQRHWDDIVIVVIVMCIIFLFVLVTGVELKVSEDVEKQVRKIIFDGKKEVPSRKDKREGKNTTFDGEPMKFDKNTGTKEASDTTSTTIQTPNN